MEIFKFRAETATTDFLERGEYINGIDDITWIERYRDAGEFTIHARVSSNLRTKIPIGALISHVDTTEVMVVENHEIDEDVEEGEAIIEITGRSLETVFEQRSVGDDCDPDGGSALFLADYVLPFDVTWNQIADLINLHIREGAGPTPLINTGDELTGFLAVADEQHIGSSVGATTRIIPRGELYNILLQFMAVDDFGIKVVRPPNGYAYTEFHIHNGVDRTGSVVFSHAAGDLQKARYFWSNKVLKTDAYVVSKYLERRINTANIGLDRRILFVDASDLDSQLTAHPTGTPRDNLLDAMLIRGTDALVSRRNTNILSTSISQTTKYQFRTDYDVGDLVTVVGNYDTESVMRVTEHVEFQDQRGESGYPTLSVLV